MHSRQANRPGGPLWRSLPEGPTACLILIVLALASRAWIFGNPVIDIDEQFYLLVGDRMLHGSLPFVDIWDRKPIGLFLIYAFANWAFPNPIVGYQLLAALSVAATACVLFAMARRVTGFAAALGGAAAYVAWLLVFEGIGGQSPVFYNLPMAAAAAIVMALAGQSDRPIFARGCAAMLLTGLAMQIKYTAVFEGLFFGMTLLWLNWTRREALFAQACHAAGWIACALVPTLAAWGVYAAMGHGEAFIQTNFLSIFADRAEGGMRPYLLLAECLAGLTLFWLCGWIAWRRWRQADGREGRQARWILLWTVAGLGGFFVFGNWYVFYLLPLLPPACLVAALAFERIAWKRTAIALLAGIGLIAGTFASIARMAELGNGDDIQRLTALIERHRGQGGIYVADGLPVLYLLTGSRLPSRYVFPDHLSESRYAASLGTGQLDELARLLDRRPGVVVIRANPPDPDLLSTRAWLTEQLQTRYRQAGSVMVGEGEMQVWAIR